MRGPDGQVSEIGCDIEFNQKHMSREHAVLQHGTDNCLYIIDLNSKSGTYVKKADGSDLHLIRDAPDKVEVYPIMLASHILHYTHEAHTTDEITLPLDTATSWLSLRITGSAK